MRGVFRRRPSPRARDGLANAIEFLVRSYSRRRLPDTVRDTRLGPSEIASIEPNLLRSCSQLKPERTESTRAGGRYVGEPRITSSLRDALGFTPREGMAIVLPASCRKILSGLTGTTERRVISTIQSK